MDLGFLSSLLGKQGDNSALTMLLPLLLGNKKPDPGASSGLGTLLSGLMNASPKKAEGFPPLFGDPDEKTSDQNGLFNVLGSLLNLPKNEKPEAKAAPEFPYELQYNRPQ